MNPLWRGVLVAMALSLLGCKGDLPGDYVPPGTENSDDPWAACTDPQKCCPEGQLKCKGNPDGVVICTCQDLWDCSKDPDKCVGEAPTPDGSGEWDCTWTEFKYVCKKKGSKSQPPNGGSDWNCTWNSKEFVWECVRKFPPNPSNKPGGAGVWKCTLKQDDGKWYLECVRDGGTPPPTTGGGVWDCVGGICTKKDENGGLPPGGGNWKCHLTTRNGKKVWVCVGEGNPSNPPGGGGWNCKQVGTEGGKTLYKCEKPEGTKDQPPGGGYWSCVKGSEFGGTKCEKVDKPPTPPGPEPKPGQKCKVGDRMWCDGLVYCGWGQVMCDPKTNTWKTTTINGKTMLDCKESLAGGKVPNTVCACYHYFYNPACCERTDCIVPPGTSGQVCPKSKGKLCDYCNPQKPECVEPGAKCIVTNAHETFCGRSCASKPCPAGYTCMTVKLKIGKTKQCVPSDYSCYY